MPSQRREMTVRIVPLRSDEAGDGRVGGSPDERLTVLAELSRRMWELTGHPLPTYTRQTIPMKLTTLRDQ